MIRSMGPGDLARVAEIDESGLGDGSPLGDRLPELLATAAVALVAEAPGAGIGGFAVIVAPDPRTTIGDWSASAIEGGGHRLHLERVAFDPEFSGHGLGPMLFDEIDARLEALAASRGVPMVLTSVVQVDPPNHHAIEFHQRRGFAEVARRRSDRTTLALVERAYERPR